LNPLSSSPPPAAGGPLPLRPAVAPIEPQPVLPGESTLSAGLPPGPQPPPLAPSDPESQKAAEAAATVALNRATPLLYQLASLSRENDALRAENAELRTALEDSRVDYPRLVAALVIGLIAVILVVVIVSRL
jgi:hypothetical protein